MPGRSDQAVLITVLAKQSGFGEAPMLVWMDDEPPHQTLATRRCAYRPAAAQQYWVKQETR